MRAVLVTPPTAEPITLPAAKLYLRQDHDDDDQLIAEQIRTSRRWCEEFTRRALLKQTWQVVLDAFPAATRLNPHGAIVLPLGRTLGVDWIKYRDPDGVEQTLTGPTSPTPGDDYQEDLTDDHGGRLMPAYGASWPSIRPVVNPIRVQFRCGYAEVADIPGQLMDAIRYRLSSVYENRGEQDTKEWQGVAEAFASPYRLEWFGR